MIDPIPYATAFARRALVFSVIAFWPALSTQAQPPDDPMSGDATSGAASPEIVVRNLPQNVFADTKVDVELQLSEPADETKRITWSLEAVGGRALKRGDVFIDAGKSAARVSCEFPPLRETVVLPLVFRATLVKTGVQKSTVGAGNAVGERITLEHKVWVFPRSGWIRPRDAEAEPKLALFDPGATTAKLLTEAAAAFEPTSNVAALGELKKSLVLVGEGLDFREYPDLGPALWRAAAAGNRVVCLAPASGSLPFADQPANPRPSSFLLRRDDVLTDLDVRFDAELWSGAEGLRTVRFAPRGEGNVPSLEMTDDAGAWPWLEVRFADTGGALVVCGFGLTEGWEKSPTPRYLLARLLALDTIESVAHTSEK
jgi:hypothetical protein